MCGTKGGALRCAKCKMTHYCSKKCQKLHFEHHNPYCTMIEGLKEVERQKIYGDLSVRQIQVNDKTRKKYVKTKKLTLDPPLSPLNSYKFHKFP